MSTIFLLFWLISIFYTNNSVLIQKTASFRPYNLVENDAVITELNAAIRHNQWYLVADNYEGFNLQLTLSSAWGFHQTHPTTLNITFDTNTTTTTSYDAKQNLMVAFQQTGTNKYFITRLDVDGDRDHLMKPEFIITPPYPSLEEGDIRQYMDSNNYHDRYKYVTNNDGELDFEYLPAHTWSYTPQSPFTLLLQNYPNVSGNYLLYTFKDSNTDDRSCGFSPAMIANAQLNIYFAPNYHSSTPSMLPSDYVTISSITVTLTYDEPTVSPTFQPTVIPTQPSMTPTNIPSTTPTYNPTDFPTYNPTNYPTEYPTNYPTYNPTNYPSYNPTKYPTNYPSNGPTLTVSTNYPATQATPVNENKESKNGAFTILELYEWIIVISVVVFVCCCIMCCLVGVKIKRKHLKDAEVVNKTVELVNVTPNNITRLSSYFSNRETNPENEMDDKHVKVNGENNDTYYNDSNSGDEVMYGPGIQSKTSGGNLSTNGYILENLDKQEEGEARANITTAGMEEPMIGVVGTEIQSNESIFTNSTYSDV